MYDLVSLWFRSQFHSTGLNYKPNTKFAKLSKYNLTRYTRKVKLHNSTIAVIIIRYWKHEKKHFDIKRTYLHIMPFI